MKSLRIRNYLRHPFITYGIPNIKWYYLVVMFSAGFFMIGNWLFFALKFVTPFEMAVIEAVSFAVGLAFEIPSGAIADLLGKKRTAQIGFFGVALGLALFMGAGWSKWFLVVGNIMTIAAFAFVSGSLEALAYDSMIEAKKADHYETVAGRISALYPLVFVVCSISGGWMWTVNHYLPFGATVVSMVIALLASTQLQEPKVDTFHFSWSTFWKQNRKGFELLTHSSIHSYLPVFLAVLGTAHMWSSGIIRIMMGAEFGYDGETLSYLVAVVFLVGAGAVFFLDQIKAWFKDQNGWVMITLLCAIGWWLAGVTSGLLAGAAVFLLLSISNQIAKPWSSTMINKVVPSEYRATTLSTLQFLIQIPYVLVVVFFGKLSESGQTGLFYISVGSLVALALTSMALRLHVERQLQT